VTCKVGLYLHASPSILSISSFSCKYFSVRLYHILEFSVRLLSSAQNHHQSLHALLMASPKIAIREPKLISEPDVQQVSTAQEKRDRVTQLMGTFDRTISKPSTGVTEPPQCTSMPVPRTWMAQSVVVMQHAWQPGITLSVQTTDGVCLAQVVKNGVGLMLVMFIETSTAMQWEMRTVLTESWFQVKTTKRSLRLASSKQSSTTSEHHAGLSSRERNVRPASHARGVTTFLRSEERLRREEKSRDLSTDSRLDWRVSKRVSRSLLRRPLPRRSPPRRSLLRRWLLRRSPPIEVVAQWGRGWEGGCWEEGVARWVWQDFRSHLHSTVYLAAQGPLPGRQAVHRLTSDCHCSCTQSHANEPFFPLKRESSEGYYNSFGTKWHALPTTRSLSCPHVLTSECHCSSLAPNHMSTSFSFLKRESSECYYNGTMVLALSDKQVPA